MKITFVSSRPSLSGGARVIAIYADLLAARGHQVTVVAPSIEQPRLPAKLRAFAKGKRLRAYPENSHYDGLTAQFKKVAHYGPVTGDDVPDADVVIATWWETAYTVALMPPEKGRKFYFVQHHETHGARNSHIRAGSYFLPLKKITIATWLVDTMRQQYGDAGAALVPNSVDTVQFNALPRGKQARPTVSLMYAPTPFKGLDVSLRALEIVRKSIPDLHVVAFGAKDVQPNMPLPPGAEFHLQPSQDKIARIYAGSDLYLFGSRSEGFGLPVLEAMACRTPVVGTRAGCVPDAVRDGENGYSVPIDDAEALAARMLDVLRQPDDQWRAMSQAARRTTEDYTWEDAAALFEAALQEAAP